MRDPSCSWHHWCCSRVGQESHSCGNQRRNTKASRSKCKAGKTNETSDKDRNCTSTLQQAVTLAQAKRICSSGGRCDGGHGLRLGSKWRRLRVVTPSPFQVVAATAAATTAAAAAAAEAQAGNKHNPVADVVLLHHRRENCNQLADKSGSLQHVTSISHFDDCLRIGNDWKASPHTVAPRAATTDFVCCLSYRQHAAAFDACPYNPRRLKRHCDTVSNRTRPHTSSAVRAATQGNDADRCCEPSILPRKYQTDTISCILPRAVLCIPDRLRTITTCLTLQALRLQGTRAFQR